MKQISCIMCLTGCRINVDVENSKHIFSGHKCEKGIEYAKSEFKAPVCSLTTMMKTKFPDAPVLSVRTSGEIPQKKVPRIIRKLSKIIVTERKQIGDTVISNISGTGCDIIATSDISWEAS